MHEIRQGNGRWTSRYPYKRARGSRDDSTSVQPNASEKKVSPHQKKSEFGTRATASNSPPNYAAALSQDEKIRLARTPPRKRKPSTSSEMACYAIRKRKIAAKEMSPTPAFLQGKIPFLGSSLSWHAVESLYIARNSSKSW